MQEDLDTILTLQQLRDPLAEPSTWNDPALSILVQLPPVGEPGPGQLPLGQHLTGKEPPT
jgi:hypothetical protein